MKRIIIILVVTLLLVAVFSLFFLRSSKEEFNVLENCVEQQVDLYYFIKALAENNPSLCYNTIDSDFCKAAVNKDASQCKDNVCKAYILKKPELCEETDYFCLAYTSNDQDKCFKLEGIDRKECLAFVLLDYEAYSRENLLKECKEQLENMPVEQLDLTKEVIIES